MSEGPDDTVEASPAARRQLAQRLGAVLRRNRMLWTAAVVACIALVAGLLAGRAWSPAQAETASAGLITAPVAWGELRNELIVRGDIAYADAVEVAPDTATLEGPAVVTGRVPEAGADLEALSVALEISGRPLIVLPGELPAYRTLQVGASGPDVVQFKTALRAVGIDGGDPASDVFDDAAAAGVAALYDRVGYPVPASAEETEDAVRLAEEAVTGAEQALALARLDLDAARAGATAAQIVAADNAVAAARRELDSARVASPGDAVLLAGLVDALVLAQTERQELSKPPQDEAERIAVTAAQSALASAQASLDRARVDELPVFPAAEVLYLSELPRRVDAVAVTHGAVVSGAAMTVSGASLALTGTVSESDAGLLTAGTEAFFELPDGKEHRAIVTTVQPAAEGDAGPRVHLVPDALEIALEQQLRGTNVRVRIPVGATEGAVLSVPAAALSSGSGGQTRVEVVEGDPRDGDGAQRRVVEVETGLATADGVEITAPGGNLEAGELVVVGR